MELRDAIRAGHAVQVKRLLDNGADPNERDVFGGYTALHRAAVAGHLDIVRLLVESGADAWDAKNDVRESALVGAIAAGKRDVVAYLLSLEDSVGHDRGRELIEVAREVNDESMVEFLVRKLAGP
jgi:ankyrin repeat protein